MKRWRSDSIRRNNGEYLIEKKLITELLKIKKLLIRINKAANNNLNNIELSVELTVEIK